MTPKEKAKELVDKFWYVEPEESCDGMEYQMAQQCALIAVNEIEEELYNWIGGDNHSWQLQRMEYFKIVKKEIEKL